MASGAIAREGFNLVHPDDYAEYGYPHEIWRRMRHEEPVHRVERDPGISYWAITKHADIVEISKQPEIFQSGPRLVISHEPEQRNDEFPATLIQMDPPKHGIYRQLVSKRFSPRALKRIDHDIEQIGKEIVDRLVESSAEGECDFVKEVSAPLPIAVIAWLLGLPRQDWELLFDWTNRIIGAGDPEYQQQGKTAQETAREAMIEVFTYFTKLVEDKRKNPADDLVSLFARAEIDGEPLPFMDVLAWCLIIVIAGNETTRNGTSGGMLAFVENQDQLRKLQDDPALLPSAVEEVVTRGSPPATRSPSSTPRPTATRRSSKTPIRSASTADRTATWASESASTSVWAPTSPAWSSPWPTSTCCPASRRSSWPARSSDSTRLSWAASSTSRSATSCGPPSWRGYALRRRPTRASFVGQAHRRMRKRAWG
jgi:cholest-4-en-3-one 26-monooxygenase